MVLKRILTRKSILGFGNYDVRDLSIQMLLDLRKYNVLICAYYNLGKIGFTDDILDELGITPEYRIEKPGKSEEKRILFFSNRLDKMTDKEKLIYFSTSKIDKQHRNRRAQKSYVGKRAEHLRAKNHGNK
jgi:hypothetical protein